MVELGKIIWQETRMRKMVWIIIVQVDVLECPVCCANRDKVVLVLAEMRTKKTVHLLVYD